MQCSSRDYPGHWLLLCPGPGHAVLRILNVVHLVILRADVAIPMQHNATIAKLDEECDSEREQSVREVSIGGGQHIQ